MNSFLSAVLTRRRSRPEQILHRRNSGRVGWVLLWLLGVPIPVLLVLYLIRGCT